MRVLVFSDVHGNLPAFEEMLKNEPDVDGFICLGDLVNYGPWSDECVELAQSLKNVILLSGNHEMDFLRGKYSGRNEIASSFFDFCFPHFTRFDLISEYLNEYQLNGFSLLHNLGSDPIYPHSEISLDRSYIIGHSHHQFRIGNNGFSLFNTGSVGQNRKYINIINYLIYDITLNKIEFKSLRYDVELIINEMKSRGYPENCIEYYKSKQRSI